ncbi:MAG: peptidoglycan DD-metalloendopeptidase family protein [Rikenellaceae bacterium]
MANRSKYQKLKARKRRNSNLAKLTIHSLAWIGAAMLYYAGFSIFFDTPHEYHLKRTSQKFEDQYDALLARYDSLELVLENIELRDKEIFRTMFESEPYNFDSNYNDSRLEEYEMIFTQSNKELEKILSKRLAKAEEQMSKLSRSADVMQQNTEAMGEKSRNIPAIQPIANSQLTLLTASYGMRMHPFYKTLKSHQGVDFTIPENTRIFATADGVVKSVTTNSTSGKEITLDHGNGYTTSYSHINSTTVGRGQKVKRGDIIARSGNTGLSITPHLHYEVSYNGMRVDPIHYFFMELTPEEYQRIIKIAQSGMQSFD